MCIRLSAYCIISRGRWSICALALPKVLTARRTRLVTTQRWIRIIIHASLTKRYKTNDRQLRYRRLPVTINTATMFSTILSRQDNKAAQIFCTYFGFVRAFPLKKEKEAHEALYLLFHKDGVPNVMVMD
jgi:hypothetical protein